MFEGAMTALVTPFKAGRVDFDAFGEEVEFQIKGGIDAIVPVGTTGESPTLSHEEHGEVVKKAVEFARKRVKVIAGTGSNSTEEAVSLTRAAAEGGADGSLQVSPYYNKPSQEGLFRHFERIAKEADIPLVLYNIPGRTGREIAVPTLVRLAELENVVAEKEAGGSVDRVSDILMRCEITIVSGDDSLTLPMMAVGAEGVISVISNIVPGDVKAMVEAAREGRMDEARRLHYKMLPVVRELFRENNPAGIKCAMRLLGRSNGELKLPVSPVSEDSEEKMRRALEGYGLL